MVVLAWLAGSVFLLLRWVAGLRLVTRLRRSATPLERPTTANLLARLRDRLGVAALPEIAASEMLDRPITLGWWRAIVLLPAQAARDLDDERLLDVLVHECAHAVRRDPAVGLLQRLAELIYWPHPLVHLLNAKLNRAREEVCDNYVLHQNKPAHYARTLFELSAASQGIGMAGAMGLFRSRWKLEDRIAGLLDPRRKTMTRVNRIALLGLLAVFLLTAVVIAGASPQERLQTLLKERAETLQKAFEATQMAYEQGVVPLKDLIAIEREWRLAELAGLDDSTARLKMLLKHERILAELEASIKAKYDVGARGGGLHEYWTIKAAHQDAEIALLQEQIKSEGAR